MRLVTVGYISELRGTVDKEPILQHYLLTLNVRHEVNPNYGIKL
jgi:hypothetical protein